MRAIKLGKQPNLSGTAEFSIGFALGQVESIEYVSGEESLESLTDKLKAAHYQVGFPTGSKAKILRRPNSVAHLWWDAWRPGCRWPMRGCRKP